MAWETFKQNRSKLEEGARIGKGGMVTLAAAEVKRADVQVGDKYLVKMDRENRLLGISLGNEGRAVPMLNNDGSLSLNLHKALESLDALPEKATVVSVTHEDDMIVIALSEKEYGLND